MHPEDPATGYLDHVFTGFLGPRTNAVLVAISLVAQLSPSAALQKMIKIFAKTRPS